MSVRRLLCILSRLFVSLSMAPLLSHLMSMGNKLEMDRVDYYAAQKAYAGWDLTGVLVVGALLTTLGLAAALRHEPRQSLLALLSFGCLAGTQAIFWTLTYPANVATSNWTEAPYNWMALREQWETSHAVSAGLAVLAMVTLILAVVSHRPVTQPLTTAPAAHDSAWMQYAT